MDPLHGLALFRIEEVLQGVGPTPIHYRIQVRQSIKYLRGPRPLSALPDQSGNKLGFQTVPDGDWNLGHIEISPGNRFTLVSTELMAFPDLMPSWHEVRIDLADLSGQIETTLDSTGQRILYPLQVGGHMPSWIFKTSKVTEKPVVALWNYDLEAKYSFALENESYIYSLLRGQTVAPTFLGHLTENNTRIVGYVLESVDARKANSADIEACREALQQLHDLGIVHGNIDRDCFLISQEDSRAQLQYFFDAAKTSDQAVKDAEMLKLEEVFRESS
ncbi:hypothetical protein B0I35DRAFT_484069 [Stachybotrys elegans]|uniref:Aminoglycoside phosphotransferase domain-containing protein n=1 Tax=Stachybotrys elegans TaxID=80388 RepID=A0A8K0SG02_9HYPO|nr:hypothetical protein B0I35DRAFT_484069 [Stachybotrys elegans]